MAYTLDRDEKGLTKREREVLRMRRAGKKAREIGELLGVSRQRVYRILQQVREKGVEV